MRRAMEYVRWELDNWRTQRHGREISIFTGAKKFVHYMWQSWKRGALLVLVLAFLPTLIPLVLFLSFVGFICAFPLLCGAATYYLFFRNFFLPLSITEFIYPSNCPSEGLIAGSQSGILHSVPLDIQEIDSRQDEALLRTSAIGEGDTEVRRRASDAKAILVLECELLGNERDEADNLEYQKMFKLNVPSGGNHESGIGSSLSVKCHPNAVFQVRGPIFLLPPAKLKIQDEQRKNEGTWSLHGTGDELSAEAPKREAAIVVSTGDQLSRSCQLETQSKGVPCTPERRHMTETDWTSDASTDAASSSGSALGEDYRGHLTAEPVFSEHTATIAPASESPETSGHSRWCAPDEKDCREGNRTLTGNTEVITGGTPCSKMHISGKPLEENVANLMHESTPELCSFISEKCIEASVKSTSTPFSYSALLTTPDDIARPDSESVIRTDRPKYWRDEVEDTVSSSAFANVAYMDHLSTEASGEVARLKSSKCEFQKVITSGQDGVYLLECAREAEGFSASQTPDSGQYEKNMVKSENGKSGSSLRFASPLFTYQRRLSFSNALADDKLVNLGCFLPSEKLNDLTPDWKQQSVSTSFCSDYTWPSESSEQGFEFLSTQGTAYEEACVDTSSTGLYEESNLECGAVSDAIFFPTSYQMTEDWETRRKRWEEESTLGRLAPLSPYMEAHSVEARSICNPLFEFSTPAPPLKKLKTQDTNYISNKRHSALPESPRTHAWLSGSKPSPHPFRLQKRKSDIYVESLDSDVFDLTTNTRSYTRSYSTSFTEPSSSEFEDLLRYWRWRDKMSQSLISISPAELSPTSISPAELAHRIREEIDAIQTVIGQEIPPQYSLWKEVEVLSQIVGMKLPYMGDMSDISKARQGLDLLKVAVNSSYDVE